jgi:hypothetical protein
MASKADATAEPRLSWRVAQLLDVWHDAVARVLNSSKRRAQHGWWRIMTSIW